HGCCFGHRHEVDSPTGWTNRGSPTASTWRRSRTSSAQSPGDWLGSPSNVYRGVRWHPPPKQNHPRRHTRPPSPQLWSSQSVLVHVPLQSVWPGGHGSQDWPGGQVQTPPTHVVPPKHCVVQFPQWFESLLKFWQPSLHQLGALDGQRMRPIL